LDPTVSIVIPTKNSAKDFRRALDSIRGQTFGDYELIVVDNHSTDDTAAIAAEYGATVIVAGPERSAQMNRAIAVARGRWLYRMDSDFVIDPTLVEECVGICTSGYDAVATSVRAADGGTFWHAVKRFERDLYHGDELIVGARFVDLQMLRDIGGFDEELVAGEDYDLHNRLLARGARIGYCKAVELHLGEADGLADVWTKNVYYGRTILRYYRKNKGRATAQLNPIRGAYLRNWRSFVAHPVLGLGLVAYTTVKYAAAACGAALSLADKRA